MSGVLSSVSIVMPVLDDAGAIERTLASMPLGPEVIVVDGGSADETVDVAESFGADVVASERGRGRQMNVGAERANGDILVFLHADTLLPSNFAAVMADFESSACVWGRFDVQLSGRRMMFRLIGLLMNWRSRFTGICTGDQAIFVRRSAFETAGGFAEIPLMEDIEFSRRMREQTWPYCPHARVVTSSRRWEENGMWRTILLMWRLRLSYFLGASPESLARQYD